MKSNAAKKKKKSNMIYVYLGIVVLLIASLFVLGNIEKDNKLYGMPVSDLNPETKALLDNPNYQNIILPDQLDKKIADKEDFYVYMFSASCKYCQVATPQLVPIAQELNVDFPMFNLLEFPTYQTKLNVEYTPTILYFQDGVEVDRLEGGIREEGTTQGNSLDDFKAFLSKYPGEAK
ncbi:thioredoxin family protein [Paenibacillus sp. GCM10027627]|uniref:thioredoxin family protein n=1 Tax=unclassified Paenibacillus TaxID=185978 RepID=UPI00363C7FCC